MRYAIISDIHANLAAFTAVLADVKRRGGVDKFWCLGDIVGYGPDPHECLEALRQIDPICVAGNHDLAAIGKIGTDEFNQDAAESCLWTARQLSQADKAYLEKLPMVIETGHFYLVHGTPRDPVWEYLLTTSQAIENFPLFKTRFCLVGHSHVPLVFSSHATGDFSGRRFLTDVSLSGRDRVIINPGGVGQPRDGDPRASYAIYDSESGLVKLYRVPYDIQTTQKKMEEHGLPVGLATRLSYGS